MMHLILLGPPGSGKGTQAALLCQQQRLVHLSTGDMLRAAVQEQSKLGLAVQALMADGQLVPDPLIIDLVKERLLREVGQAGYLLDGFPRTLAQAKALTQSDINIDQVIVLTISDASVLKRLCGRRVHLPSGRVYHINYQPPKVADSDDVTGEPLTQRPDDAEQIIRHRLLLYHQQTAPLIDYYRLQAQQRRCRYAEVAAEQPMAEVSAALSQLLADLHGDRDLNDEVSSIA